MTIAWHAYIYDGLDKANPPIRTEWIEAETEREAIDIARHRLGSHQRAELIRPRWESAAQPLVVLSADPPQAARARFD